MFITIKNDPMKFNFHALMMICLLITNCKNKTTTTKTDDTSPIPAQTVLSIETDSFKVIIKEVDKSNHPSYLNSQHSEPFLGMKAECISLKELLGIIKGIELNSIILEDKSLENQYYSVLVNQNVINSQQDSIVKYKIFESLNLGIKKKVFNIDTVIVTVDNKRKFLKYANNTVSDTIRSQSMLSQDSLIFENYNLEKILATLSKEFNKTLFLNVEEPQRINIKLRKSDWNSTKAKLEFDLGLAFSVETTQEEKYIVSKNALIEKN